MTAPEDVRSITGEVKTKLPGITFAGLEISDIVAGGPDDDMGVVEFTARLRGPDGLIEMHERSRFSRRAGRWMYVDGEPDVGSPASAPMAPPTQLGQR